MILRGNSEKKTELFEQYLYDPNLKITPTRIQTNKKKIPIISTLDYKTIYNKT